VTQSTTPSTARPLLEIAAGSLGSALAAQTGGADRIELCANLGEGGTTPSHGTLAVARDRVRIPLYAIIRPRAGDFCYDDADIDVMQHDVETCVALGYDGVVIGALDVDGDVDEAVCRVLINAASTLGVTFHRAFDVVRDRQAALETIIALGCERVLTSGGAESAVEGAEAIAATVRQASSRIRVMAGAGITPNNIGDVVRRSDAHEFHASARSLRVSPSRRRDHGLPGLDADRQETDAGVVRAMVEALERAHDFDAAS